MKTIFKFLTTLSVVIVALAIASTSAAAQLNSNVGTVTLNATLPESLSVNITSGATVNFTLAGNTATNAGAPSTGITTAWVLKPGRNTVTVWAYVATSTAALTDGSGDNIAGSAVSVTTTATAGTPTVANGNLGGTTGLPAFVPAGGSGLQFASKTITGANKASSLGVSLAWNIDTTPTPQLPAGTYTGTVSIEAQAAP